MDERAKLLRMIQQYDFSMYELSLYLDTHPKCGRALERFNNLNEMRSAAAAEYTTKYGPLNHHDVSADKTGTWSWVSSPWPWERSE